MRNKLGLLMAMAMFGDGLSKTEFTINPVNQYSGQSARSIRPIYHDRTYGAGTNQRKRRKYARQTPSASRWRK